MLRLQWKRSGLRGLVHLQEGLQAAGPDDLRLLVGQAPRREREEGLGPELLVALGLPVGLQRVDKEAREARVVAEHLR